MKVFVTVLLTSILSSASAQAFCTKESYNRWDYSCAQVKAGIHSQAVMDSINLGKELGKSCTLTMLKDPPCRRSGQTWTGSGTYRVCCR